MALAEFFRLEGNLWVNGRVEEELEKARGRIATARANGKRAADPPKRTRMKPMKNRVGFRWVL